MIICYDENLINLFSSLSALIIAIIALIYTIRAYLLKSGQKIRSNYVTTSTIECDDSYISSITLENIKDRATIILKIYMQYGHNNYLLIEDFSDAPLILKPFEVYHKEFGPILFYSCSSQIIKLNNVIDNKKVKQRIVLATTNGKYITKTNFKGWDPIGLFFTNFYTAIIDHQRLQYKDISYGSRVKFLLIFKYKLDKEVVIPLHEGDEKLNKFEKIQLTKKSLHSKEDLEFLINDQFKKGNLKFEEFEVIDFHEHYKEKRNWYNQEPVSVESLGFFKYNIIGRIITIKENRKMKMENKKRNNVLKKSERE